MLHSIMALNMGHPIVHHFGEGAAVWGQALTPSVAHLVQIQRELAIDYSRIRPGIVFEAVRGMAMLPHIVDPSTLRVHIGASAFRRVVIRPNIAVESVLHCEVGEECVLRLWGRVVAEDSHFRRESSGKAGQEATVPVLFNIVFWVISRATEGQMQRMIEASAEKDRRIRELELKVALSMCSQ